MAAQRRHRALDDPRATPTPASVLGPAAGLVALLLLLVLVTSPSSLLVRVSSTPEAVATVGPAVPSGRAAPPRGDPELREPDTGALVATALTDLLDQRDSAVASGRASAWPVVPDAADDAFAVLSSLPVTRFESAVVPDSLVALDDDADADDGSDGAGESGDEVTTGHWQARVETLYELADGPAVVRTDTVRLRPGDTVDPSSASARWQLVSWTPYPQQGEIGTAAPWDLGPVTATVGERAVVLTWAEPGADPSGVDTVDASDGDAPDGDAPDGDQDEWGRQVLAWADTGAVTVDSYLGTGWPRLSMVLVPATSEQYAGLVPGPRPEVDDVFAAVTTDVDTPDGGGDLVVLNPSARDQLVPETWQVTVTHELVHVASGAIHGDEQEIWLAEGFADLVGWSSVVPGAVDRDVVAARLLERVAAGTADLDDLPDGDDFGSGDAEVVGDAYEGSWLAALLLEDEIGTDALLDVYASASTGGGSARERTDAALLAATGESREAFLARWVQYLDQLAAEPW